MSGSVDRTVARMIAFKRIATGGLSLACGVALIVALAIHGSPPPVAGVALLLFFGGGAWTLRDGLRLKRAIDEHFHSGRS